MESKLFESILNEAYSIGKLAKLDTIKSYTDGYIIGIGVYAYKDDIRSYNYYEWPTKYKTLDGAIRSMDMVYDKLFNLVFNLTTWGDEHRHGDGWTRTSFPFIIDIEHKIIHFPYVEGWQIRERGAKREIEWPADFLNGNGEKKNKVGEILYHARFGSNDYKPPKETKHQNNNIIYLHPSHMPLSL